MKKLFYLLLITIITALIVVLFFNLSQNNNRYVKTVDSRPNYTVNNTSKNFSIMLRYMNALKPNSVIIVNYSNIFLYSGKKLIYTTGPIKIKFNTTPSYKKIGSFTANEDNITNVRFNLNSAELYLNNKNYTLNIFDKNISVIPCCYNKDNNGILIDITPLFIQLYGGIKNNFYYYQTLNSSFEYNNTHYNYSNLNITKFRDSIGIDNSIFEYKNNSLIFSFNLINKLGMQINITEIRIFGAIYFIQSPTHLNSTMTYYNISNNKQNNTYVKIKHGENLLMPIVFGGQILGIGPNNTINNYNSTIINSKTTNGSSFNRYYMGMLNFIVEKNGTISLPTYQNNLYNIGYLSANRTLHFDYNKIIILDNFTCKIYNVLNCSLIEPETLGFIINSNYTLSIYSNYGFIGNITNKLN